MEKQLHPLDFVPNTDQFDITREDLRSQWLDYEIASRYSNELPEQKFIVENSRKNKLPEIQVGPFEGHLLSILLKMQNAKRGVEIGTLGGYSSSWICRAIEGQQEAHLDCLELDPNFAKLAEGHLVKWKNIVKIHVGSAKDTMNGELKNLSDLDFVFIDADKASYPQYFDWAWDRIRKGGVILLDNFYLFGGIYFANAEKFPSDFAQANSKIAGRNAPFTETAWTSMKSLWKKLEMLGDKADKTILPTGEGLGLVRKR